MFTPHLIEPQVCWVVETKKQKLRQEGNEEYIGKHVKCSSAQLNLGDSTDGIYATL